MATDLYAGNSGSFAIVSDVLFGFAQSVMFMPV
jgi:hypothetical protein